LVRELRLVPPPTRFEGLHQNSSTRPSIFRTTLVTAAVTLGPQEDQEIWAKHLNLKPIWLTIFGAGAELVGGLVNLGADADRGIPLLLFLDLYLVGEALARMSYVVARGRPIGSVFGWILRPLYKRWMPASE
jgi:hypothetical protein